ncbi:hypothetical protein Bhyg_00434 [Pseudolycoriella hygida]|uniref:Uncharacterized protein n=1 Tax=Pseudolycoriella hygida TaxID=35572 RepID=A0A9Q0S6F1_9DIPT|nr:hypothetical protein Bhyg_00434 [Pseudolycoriella hygida]
MFTSLRFILIILQVGGFVLVNNANPVTNFDASRVSSLSASGQSYGDISAQNSSPSSSSSPNGRILSQPSTADKDSITYPDDIIRDSYGNIVTPYSTLAEDVVSTPRPSNVGLLTDVNKDHGQHLQFVIPSYSDGITEIQGPYKPHKPSSINAAITPPIQTLLPPLSNGNYNYPSLDSHNVPADNSYQNEIGGSFPSSAQSFNTAPAPTGPTAITTNGHVGNVDDSPSKFSPNFQVPFNPTPAGSNQPIETTTFNQQTSIGSQTHNRPSSLTHGSSDFSAIHVSSPDVNAPSSTFTFSNTKPLKDTQFVNQVPINIQVNNEKYTGGFGGAPGILGEQKVPGYAVKPSVNKPTSIAPQISSDPGVNSIHAHQPISTPNQGPQNDLPNVLQPPLLPNQNGQVHLSQSKPDNNNQGGSISQPNTNHGSFQFGTSFSSNPTIGPQVNNNGKYTGGFGGAPGILSPFDNVKTGKNIVTDSSATSNSDPKRKY